MYIYFFLVFHQKKMCTSKNLKKHTENEKRTGKETVENFLQL